MPWKFWDGMGRSRTIWNALGRSRTPWTNLRLSDNLGRSGTLWSTTLWHGVWNAPGHKLQMAASSTWKQHGTSSDADSPYPIISCLLHTRSSSTPYTKYVVCLHFLHNTTLLTCHDHDKHEPRTTMMMILPRKPMITAMMIIKVDTRPESNSAKVNIV